MLTALKPQIARILGTPHEDAFETLGEPIAVRGLCPDGVRALFDVELEELESVRVELSGNVI